MSLKLKEYDGVWELYFDGEIFFAKDQKQAQEMMKDAIDLKAKWAHKPKIKVK